LCAVGFRYFISCFLFYYIEMAKRTTSWLDTPCLMWHICQICQLRKRNLNKNIHHNQEALHEKLCTFTLGWLWIMHYLCNNKLEALFILSLLNYHNSTCFRRINSPSSGGRMYICSKWCLFYF
jgi:hypothetical protein